MNRPTLILSVVLSLAAGALRAQQPPAGARATPQGVVIDFQDTDLRYVITALAEAANLNVSFGDLPAKKITLRVHQPVRPDSVPALLRSLAESNGLKVVAQGGLLRFEAPPAPVQQPVAPSGRGGATGDQRLFIYRLRHAQATRLAQTLQALFGGEAPPSQSSYSRPTLSQQLRGQMIAPTLSDTLGRRPTIEVQPQAPVALSAQLQGAVQIVPDETTNSLLVRALPGDWETLQEAIRAVDIRPLQVLIEVLIAEVRRTSDLEVSVSGKVSKTNPGETEPSKSAELKGNLTGDVLLKWMTGGKIDVNVALSLLAARGDVRILSRPVLLAQNNLEAHIMIGSQRPFVQVFRSLPTESGVRDQIVQYRDVGTQLTIIPTVNPDGYVNLQLTQEVSSATNETQFDAPVISTREASTYLFVRDGQTTVIGGLIDRQREDNRSGIPVLIDIPILGALFGTTTHTTSQSELFLFLTPHIVQSDEDVDRMREGLERRLEQLPKEMEHFPPAVKNDSTRVRPPGGGNP